MPTRDKRGDKAAGKDRAFVMAVRHEVENLIRRGNIFYWRPRVPAALINCGPGSRLSLSLHCSDNAAQSFGVFQNQDQYGEVIWRFSPEVASRASEFCFHPRQNFEWEEDGGLIVRFHASGWLEMAWHLYQWGDKVQVVAPEGLRLLIEGYGRADFEALP
jgi:hypothetical protein